MVDQAGSSGADGADGDVPELGALQAALAELAALDPAALDDGALHALAVGLTRAGSVLDAVACRHVGAWADRAVFRSDGSKSAKARLARDARCAPARAGRIVNLAANLAEYFTEEQPSIARRRDVEGFCAEVARLPDEVARIEARIAALETNGGLSLRSESALQ